MARIKCVGTSICDVSSTPLDALDSAFKMLANVTVAQEYGRNWAAALLIMDQSFVMHNTAFWCAHCIQIG